MIANFQPSLWSKPVLEIISAIGSLLAGSATCAGLWVAYTVHKNQKLLAQRQLIIPLWDYMSSLRKFDPLLPITGDAIKIVNTLELVAICCEGEMIDEKVILRTFTDQFINHYESIKSCPAIPGLNINGEKLLLENLSAVQFYRKLDNIRVNARRLTP
ncbi:hypothetical protein GCN74_03480 [Janthinobacterium sp. FT14W]|uniref:hypothetical protein n=1 Tax=Janthinobacterium sp. FT14W TaxID=2654253 RepID=UPI001264F016|nr:hypothetical protein [Janthinobacterium sp. FT14W]KAB8062099.1 hypothetical protein GCN74_03480 [Janthinobacterium sp. FT14W]